MKQLTLWEVDKLSEFNNVKFWSVRSQNKQLPPYVPIVLNDYVINRRGQIYSNKSNKIISNLKIKDYEPYDRVGLYILNNKKSIMFSVHRLVACTFIECIDKEKYNFVDHIDGNKKNNHYLNLRWVTNQQNQLAVRQDINQLQLI